MFGKTEVPMSSMLRPRGESPPDHEDPGMTIVEKILAAHADRDVVRPGEFVAAGVDLMLAHDITGPDLR